MASFITKRRRFNRELEELTREWVTNHGAESTFAEMVVAEPETAKRMVWLHIVLGEEVTERVTRHFDLDPMEVRAEAWGSDLIEQMKKIEQEEPA